MDVSAMTELTTAAAAAITTAVAAATTAPLAAPDSAAGAVAPAIPDIAKAVYIFCMASGFLWLLLTAFLGPLFGEFGGHDSDAFHLQGDIHFSPMSPSVISAFMAAFGCGGLLAMGVLKITSLQSLPIALGAGVLVGGFIYYVVRYVFLNVQGGVEVPSADMLGTEAEVLTSIPENGVGEITYATSSGRQSSPARSDDGSPVAAHSIVEIVRISGPHKIVRVVSQRVPQGSVGTGGSRSGDPTATSERPIRAVRKGE